MRRHAHRQHYRALRSFAFGDFHCAFYRSRVSRNHDLGWRIEIGRFDDFIGIAGFLAGRSHDLILESQDGRHRADARRHRLLHGLCAKAHERHRVGKIDRTTRNQGAVFTQTMARRYRRRSPFIRDPCAMKRDVRREHYRLRIDREIELFPRPVLNELPEVLADRVRGLGESIAHSG